MDIEQELSELLAHGDLRATATLAVEGYGAEVLGFLVTLLRDHDRASEVFSQTCEDLWIGLAGFQGRSSLRTWFYTLARHAASRQRRFQRRRGGQHFALSEASEIAAQVRSQTLPHLRTEVKDGFAEIRDALPEDDRALLVLRVDRRLPWADIARVFSPVDATKEELARVASKLRKRFERLKEEIRERALQAGLLRAPEE